MKTGFLLMVLATCGQTLAQDAERLATELDGDGNKAFTACRQLMRMGKAAAPVVPAVTKALNHYEPNVRKQAILTLGAIGEEASSALPVITKMILEDDVAIKEPDDMRDAILAVRKIGRDAVPLLAAIALQGTRHFDEKSLKGYREIEPRPFDERAVESDVGRAEAIEALGAIEDASAFPVLMHLMPAIDKMELKKGQRKWEYAQSHLMRLTIKAISQTAPKNDEKAIEAIDKYALRFQIEADTAIRRIKAKK